MNTGMMRGVITGAILGATAATAFGVMNWEREKQWKNQAMRMGKNMLDKADKMMSR